MPRATFAQDILKVRLGWNSELMVGECEWREEWTTAGQSKLAFHY